MATLPLDFAPRPRSPLLTSAGNAMVSDASPSSPMRLLATAYDSEWKRKKVVSKDSIPLDWTSRSLLDGTRRSQSHGALVRRSSKLNALTTKALELPRPSSSPGSRSPSSPASPMSAHSPFSAGRSPKSRSSKSRGSKGSMSLPNLLLDANRPSSAASDKETTAMENKEKERKMLEENSDDGREEKPLGEWAEDAGVPLDLAQQALDTFMAFVSHPPSGRHKVKKEAILFGSPFDAKADIGSMDADAFGKSILRIAFTEFKILVNKLLKIPKGEELPERRSKDMWREASRATAGKDLDFIAFVGWYKRYFMGDESYDESPFEAYYHNIRRVSAYDSNQFH